MNYGEIQASIIARSHRTDLASHVPEFVALAESEYNRRTGATYDLTSGTSSTHNWVSDNAPDVYIYGGLMQLAVWTQDDNALQKFTALFERAVETAHYAEVRESGITTEPLTIEAGIPSSYDIMAD